MGIAKPVQYPSGWPGYSDGIPARLSGLAGCQLAISRPDNPNPLACGLRLACRWPALAKQFNVNTSGVGQQLPTLVVFEKGKEVVRIPHVYPDGSVAKGSFRKVGG